MTGPHPSGGEATPADALARHWTKLLPAPLLPYAQLSRLDRPIGWQLLLLPCWMGIALESTQLGFWPRDYAHGLYFLIGAIAMRGAGCVLNDIVDRDIDAKVERTKGRPLPSGRVTLWQGWAWLGAQCAIGLVVLLALPPLAQITALIAVPFVAIYPFMKRVTWWPQAWLGIVFAWGALVGGAATANALTPETLLLYVGCFFWVMAYDTIYALQDREDDALVGVKSTALLFKDRWRDWVLGFYAAALFLWSTALYVGGAAWPSFVVLVMAGALVIWPVFSRIDDAAPTTALVAFKANALIGLSIVIVFAFEPAWRMLQSYFLYGAG
ncbi:MAG: 4-hydroxybenzoate octaprenyltransferase [Alphaproteobacteria bacterium]|nr:4-hydroxybenzoate octaprenyltransferase [Alphaproteobacteria bacterium]